MTDLSLGNINENGHHSLTFKYLYKEFYQEVTYFFISKTFGVIPIIKPFGDISTTAYIACNLNKQNVNFKSISKSKTKKTLNHYKVNIFKFLLQTISSYHGLNSFLKYFVLQENWICYLNIVQYNYTKIQYLT